MNHHDKIRELEKCFTTLDREIRQLSLTDSHDPVRLLELKKIQLATTSQLSYYRHLQHDLDHAYVDIDTER